MDDNDIKFYRKYIDTVNNTYKKLDLKILKKISLLIFNKIKNNNNIFVCGNGGSASIANHFLCDFNKGIKISSKNVLLPKIVSLSTSVELITAIANDIDFKKIFTNQFENYASSDDLLLVFSSSGESKNIKDIEKCAFKKKIKVVKFYGFLNKFKPKKNEILLNLNVNNYGVSEDIFQGVMHMISQNIRSNFIKNFSFDKVKL
jgi:phosphoheptose isomerase